MKLRKSFALAISNILSNKTRSLLTMLGIVIGIMAVISLISLMNGVTSEVTDMFDEMGTTSITVSIQNRGTSRMVTAKDIYRVADENRELISGVTPTVTVNATLRTKTDSDSVTTRVTGVSEVYAKMTKTEVEQGAFFQYIDVDRLQNVCVIGTYIQDYFFGRTPALGESIKINGVSYKIVGILEEKADSAKGSSDEVVYIPYTTATRMNGNTTIPSFTVYAHTEETVDLAVEAIKMRLNQVLGDSDFYNVTSMKEIRDSFNTITGMMTTALVFIAGISLLVGGIGIMNIMLVTVTERTKEIGIRKALGTKRRDIMAQFVIEAATLSGIGGIIGIFAGMGLSRIVGIVAGINATPTTASMLLSFGVSAAIGIGFGYLPAKRASGLNPIDALRYE